MTWWQAILIAGSIALGVLTGMLLVRVFFKNKLGQNGKIPANKATNTHLQNGDDPLSKLILEYKSAYNGQKAQFENIKNIPEKDLRSTKEAEPITPVPENPDRKEQEPFISPVSPISKIAEPVVEKSTVKSTSGIVTELESNLKIAAAHRVDQPVSFQTQMWDTNHNDVNGIPAKVITELGEVYISMRVANNLAWSITEFGDSTHELSTRYNDLCTGIATRLTNILNKIQ